MEKTVIRAGVFEELGNRTDDLLDSYKIQLREFEGVVQGLIRAQALIDAMLPDIDKEIDARNLDFEQGKLLKDWILRASKKVDETRALALQNAFVARGRVDAVQQQVALIKRYYDVERAKAAEYVRPPTTSEAPDNVVDIGSAPRDRPVSLKTRRIQEDVHAPVPEAPAKKKRGRKPKNQGQPA